MFYGITGAKLYEINLLTSSVTQSLPRGPGQYI